MLTKEFIGKQINIARRMCGLSQKKLADIVMMSPQSVSKWERGDSLPDVIMLCDIAAALNKPVTFFLGLDKSESFQAVQSDAPHDAFLETEREQDAEFNREEVIPFAENGKRTDADMPEDIAPVEKTAVRDSDVKRDKIVKAYDRTKWKNENFTNADFSEYTVKGAEFEGCNFENVNLIKAVLSEIKFKTADMRGTDFSETLFSSSQFEKCAVFKGKMLRTQYYGSRFTNCSINDTAISFADFGLDTVKDCEFLNLGISGVIFEKCRLENIRFINVDFDKVFFKLCRLKNVQFSSCRMDRASYNLLKGMGANLDGLEAV